MRNRNFYVYKSYTFADQHELIMHLSKTHPELVHKEIVVRVIGHYDVRHRFLINYPEETFKLCLPKWEEHKIQVPTKKIKISDNGIRVRYSLNGQAAFERDGKKVPDLQQLAVCSLKRRQLKFGSNCQREFHFDEAPICVKEKFPKNYAFEQLLCEKPNTMLLLTFQKSLQTNSFSNKVWLSVWKDKFTYECFSRNKFQLLKQRFLKEINMYRKAHQASPLIENAKMTEKAQIRALKVANSRRVFADQDTEYEEIVYSCEILLAPFTVKKIYDEINKYKYSFPNKKVLSKNFLKLIWRSTSFIGIGVAKSYCHLIVILKLTPRKNIVTGYRADVKVRNKNA
uniref:SCP domain-containing protein n=1 Tax=Strongyloides venezuelensis TaxID=75913 RepID=A0A0K0FN16_STRVS